MSRRLVVAVVVVRDLAGFVLQSTPDILELAFSLVGLAFAHHLLVAEQRPGAFLHLATGLLHAAFGAIVVDHVITVVHVEISFNLRCLINDRDALSFTLETGPKQRRCTAALEISS